MPQRPRFGPLLLLDSGLHRNDDAWFQGFGGLTKFGFGPSLEWQRHFRPEHDV